MDNKAARRIKGGNPEKVPAKDSYSSDGRGRSIFSRFIIVSMLVHATALAAVWQFSKPAAPDKVIELINVSVLPLPGPAGGGGKSEEIKFPKEQPKKKEVPEKEPVKVPEKLVEKVKPEPKKKEPEKLEAPKPQPQMPAGPGQGPVGGGGKKVPENAIAGPVATNGNDSPLLRMYLQRLQMQVDRRWRTAVTVSFSGRVQPKAVLYFVIDKNGRISNPTVTQTSGNVSYDNSAIGVIRDIQRVGFDRFPPGLGNTSLGIYYTFLMENK